MEYGLTRLVLGCEHFVPLSEGEFIVIREAKQQSDSALGSEEKLEMVLQNYVEYEHDLLQIALRYELFSMGDWSDFTNIIHQINRRLVNLLSAARLYLDQLEHDAGPVLGTDTVKRLKSAEYDARLGYRVMEALRNHIQHRGLPLHSVTLDSRWIKTDEGNRRKANTLLYLNVQTLAEDRKFKRSVLNELGGQNPKVPLKPLVRDYITGIMQIQRGIRNELAPRVDAWDDLLRSLISRYRAEAEDDVVGLSAVKREPDGTYRGRVSIFTDTLERRRWLERKNRGAGELGNIIVSSE